MLTCALQVALVGLGKNNDYVAPGPIHGSGMARDAGSLQ